MKNRNNNIVKILLSISIIVVVAISCKKENITSETQFSSNNSNHFISGKITNNNNGLPLKGVLVNLYKRIMTGSDGGLFGNVYYDWYLKKTVITDSLGNFSMEYVTDNSTTYKIQPTLINFQSQSEEFCFDSLSKTFNFNLIPY